MRWMIALLFLLAGCAEPADTTHDHDHDHGDHDHAMAEAPSISVRVDETEDSLTVIQVKHVNWNDVYADLTDGCTGRLEAAGMAADIEEGQPLMSHSHSAEAGDVIFLEGTGMCRIVLTHAPTEAVLITQALEMA